MDIVSTLPTAIAAWWGTVNLPALATQATALVGAALIAWLAHARWRRAWPAAEGATPSLGRLVFAGSLRVVFPVTMLALVVLAAAGLVQLGWEVALLDLAVPLLGSLAAIRLTVFLLRKTFAPSRALRAWENVISTSAWTVVALHLVGWLPAVLSILDGLALPLGGGQVSLLLVIKLALAVGTTLILALWLSKLIERAVMGSVHLSAGARIGLAKFAKFFLLTVAILVGLNTAGLDLTALAIFGGALGVGLGFGLQRIASNFVSGFILLFDRSVRPGDVITVGDNFGWVQEMHARYLVIRNRDGVDTLIPNENLVTSQVINWSYGDSNVRVKVPVQISYDDDPELAMQLMMEAGQAHPRVLAEPAPSCRLIGFGDNGIDLQLRVWVADPERGIGGVRSDINLAIWKAFQRHRITIPYPQRDLYIKTPAQAAALTEAAKSAGAPVR